MSEVTAGGVILWFTGLSGSGKTTLSRAVAALLQQRGRQVLLLDGDELRQTHSRDLGFSRQDRVEHQHRIAAIAFQAAEQGTCVLVAAISPFRAVRAALQQAAPVPFFEVFVDAPLALCEERDPKGLYRRARAGQLQNMTGIDDLYEPPLQPAIHCLTGVASVEECVCTVLARLERP